MFLNASQRSALNIGERWLPKGPLLILTCIESCSKKRFPSKPAYHSTCTRTRKTVHRYYRKQH